MELTIDDLEAAAAAADEYPPGCAYQWFSDDGLPSPEAAVALRRGWTRPDDPLGWEVMDALVDAMGTVMTCYCDDLNADPPAVAERIRAVIKRGRGG